MLLSLNDANKVKSALAWACVALVVLSGAGCGKKQGTVQEVVRPVRMVQVSASPATEVAEFAGEVRPRIESRLGFRVGGKLTERLVEVGQTVKAGQVLARIDATDLQLQKNAAQAQLEAATADRNQSLADLKRYSELKDKGFISQAELDRRTAATDVSVSRYEQALAQLKVQGNQAAYGTLVADKAGVVTAVLAETGQVVAPGQAVIALAQAGDVEVSLAVPEQKVSALKLGQDAQVVLWAKEGALKARVREISPVADPLTRAFPVRVTLLEGLDRARYGMSATVRFETPQSNDAIRLPLTALVAEKNAAWVWVWDEKTTEVHKVQIKPFGVTGNELLVDHGLATGQWVVTAGTHVLTEGQKAKRFIEPEPVASPASGR